MIAAGDARSAGYDEVRSNEGEAVRTDEERERR
jgi:hypothetical protein